MSVPQTPAAQQRSQNQRLGPYYRHKTRDPEKGRNLFRCHKQVAHEGRHQGMCSAGPEGHRGPPNLLWFTHLCLRPSRRAEL